MGSEPLLAADPDLLIVDKEPTGFRGELLPTLETLTNSGRTRIVLGLRDVLDEPEVLASEWERKGALDAAEAIAVDYADLPAAVTLQAALQPDGIVITQFNGAPAGQTVFHTHVHIIPRYEGIALGAHGGGGAMADMDELGELAAKIGAAL